MPMGIPTWELQHRLRPIFPMMMIFKYIQWRKRMNASLGGGARYGINVNAKQTPEKKKKKENN